MSCTLIEEIECVPQGRRFICSNFQVVFIKADSRTYTLIIVTNLFSLITKTSHTMWLAPFKIFVV
jgi:hypothetical protein